MDAVVSVNIAYVVRDTPTASHAYVAVHDYLAKLQNQVIHPTPEILFASFHIEDTHAEVK